MGLFGLLMVLGLMLIPSLLSYLMEAPEFNRISRIETHWLSFLIGTSAVIGMGPPIAWGAAFFALGAVLIPLIRSHDGSRAVSATG